MQEELAGAAEALALAGLAPEAVGVGGVHE